METKKNNLAVVGISGFIIIFFVTILAIPSTREIFREMSGNHPFILGFIKFGLLATVGEVISLRFASGVWKCPTRVAERAVIWGLLGIAITFIMKVFSGGIASIVAAGILPGEGNLFLTALYTSVAMNCVFAPTMMGLHRLTDRNIDMKVEGIADRSIQAIAQSVNWGGFVSFVVMKTIPIFWVPAHTITFMLPPEYQTIMAASLSVALGTILGFAAKKK